MRKIIKAAIYVAAIVLPLGWLLNFHTSVGAFLLAVLAVAFLNETSEEAKERKAHRELLRKYQPRGKTSG